MYLIGLTDSNTCTQCPTVIDNHFHAFWTCTPVRLFWSEVMRELSMILNLSIPLSPSISQLGDLSSLAIPQHIQTFILIAVTVAKKTILLNWKEWFNLLTDHSNLEKLTSALNDNMTLFLNTWSPFLQFIYTWFLSTPQSDNSNPNTLAQNYPHSAASILPKRTVPPHPSLPLP